MQDNNILMLHNESPSFIYKRIAQPQDSLPGVPEDLGAYPCKVHGHITYMLHNIQSTAIASIWIMMVMVIVVMAMGNLYKSIFV
jgi:hypothetical protein